MSDMSESKHRELLKEGLRALDEEQRQKKQQAVLDKFSGGSQKHGLRRGLTDEKAANPYAESRIVAQRDRILNALSGKKFKLPFTSRSLTAFLLLPQFHLTFRHASHIYPVFMRALAAMLVQAGLLPQNHPALRYGENGVPRSRFKDMMGETWFRLRTMRGATYQQYGMFSLVVLMVLTLTATVATFFTRIFLGIGTASAQLYFTHPADPYGAGVGVTDMTAVGAIPSASGLFDSRIEGAGISKDYGLMVLDKILRQAAADTPTGGAMQNALATMMATYNTGVTIVGSVILLWMITSIVIDTAKAGVLGGGRHNMVWAPIRVLFAALLLIPLGTGFSAGQYGVMKLAEWGSNFGTRAWTEYVAGVLNTDNLLAPFANNSSTSLVKNISKLMTCQVVYNTHLRQTQGSLPARHKIVIKTENDPNQAMVTNRYTNDTGSNICGTIQYGTGATTDDIDRILTAATINSQLGGSARWNAANNPPTTAQSFKIAARDFRKAMRGAMQTTLAETTPDGNLGSGGTAIEMGRRFACRFAAFHMSDGGVTPHPVSQIPQCAGDASLVAPTPASPNFTEQTAMNAELQRAVMDQYNNVAKPVLNVYITNNLKPNMTERGWAGMGMWVQEIDAMNTLIAAVKSPVAVVEPGTAWVKDGNAIGGQNWLRCGVNFITLRPCRISGIEEKTLESLSAFNGWWEETGADSQLNPRDANAYNSNKDMSTEGGSRIMEMLEWIGNMSGGDNSLGMVMARLLIPPSDSVFLFRAVDIAATGTYPITQLVDTGHSVLGFGTFLWGMVSLVQALSSLKGYGFGLGLGIAIGALTNLFAALGSAMIVGGLMMSFYLPVIPLLRVAFSVLTWMIMCFEAVVMVPIAALGHLVSTGDGLTAGNGQLRTAWMLWLNVLMRPVLTVVGFVAGLLIYNTFAVYFHTSFSSGAINVMSDQSYITTLFTKCSYTAVYLMTMYAAANTCFKLMDVFPEQMMRWLGGSPDRTLRDLIDKSDLHEVSVTQLNRVVKTGEGTMKEYNQRKAQEKSRDIADRGEKLRKGPPAPGSPEAAQYSKDVAATEKAFNRKQRAEYDNASPDRKNEMLAEKFMDQHRFGMGVKAGLHGGLRIGTGEAFGSSGGFMDIFKKKTT